MVEIYKDIFCRTDKPGPAATTVGTFDGVHLGHQKILECLNSSGKQDLVQTVVTFDPHPQSVTHSRGSAVSVLTCTAEKIRLLSSHNIDRIFILRFDRELARLSAEDFIREILLEQLKTRKLIIGYNHSFGHNREGNLTFLKNSEKRFGFTLEVVLPHYVNGEIVSSTKVRQALLQGDVERAMAFLGRPYSMNGLVVPGQGLGRKLDYPTANLKLLHEEKLVPQRGVYAVVVEAENAIFPGMLNIGTRPTFGECESSIEVHLIGFSGDLYGKVINLQFLGRLRDEKRYSSVAELREQMRRDRAASLKFFQSFARRKTATIA